MASSADAEAGNGGTPEACLLVPQIRFCGEIGPSLYDEFRNQLDAAEENGDGAIVVELTTLGGDADLARRMALDIRLCRVRTGRRVIFLGKTSVYSAGVVIMAAFAREDRYLTRDTVLLIHERQLDLSVQISGPLRRAHDQVRGLLNQIEIGTKLEDRGFADLCAGSDVSTDECRRLAASSWYLEAEEALRRGLVQGLL